MNRPAARRAAFAIALAIAVATTLPATADLPEADPGGNPSRLTTVSPDENLVPNQSVQVSATGLPASTSGEIVLCTTTNVCSDTQLQGFTANASGAFGPVTVAVPATFQSQGQLIDCRVVTCKLALFSLGGELLSSHRVAFVPATTTTIPVTTTAAPTTTTIPVTTTTAPTTTTIPATTTTVPTTTTIPATTTTVATTTTIPATTTTVATTTTIPATTTTVATTTTIPATTTTAPTTTTTLPPTPPPANPLCSALLQLRSQVAATLDALGSSFPAIRPFAAQVLTLFDRAIALFGCGGDSAGAAAAPPAAGLPIGPGLNLGDLLGVTGFGQPTAGSEQASAGEYVVVPGDTLFALSERLFGDGDLYPTLVEMNQDRIEDADLLTPGQLLRIPAGAG